MLNENEKTEELLGSVTQLECSSPGSSGVPVRSSARVSKKLKLDSSVKPVVIGSNGEKKDGIKEENDILKKNESKQKKIKSLNWSAQGKDIFFEALNEYGKDFEAIQRYFALKSKKKSNSEIIMKTKEQIRHFYYRTWAKISKHLKFPPDTKKQTQELYGLINYGEFRKKMGCVTEKTSLKLNELIIRGFTQLRVRGKNVHIRTPRCRTLRRLNLLEDCQDDIKLPSRISVELVPRYNDSWARVQSIAQNPRVQVIVPLQYRLTNLLQYFQKRWLPVNTKYKNKILNSYEGDKPENDEDELLVVAPKPDAAVHITEINLSQYLTSNRLCLSSYEERLGKKGICEEILKNLKAESRRKGKKQLKTEDKDSKKFIEKSSPESKKLEGEESVKCDAGKMNLKQLLFEDRELKSSDTDLLSPDLSNDEKPNFSFGAVDAVPSSDLNDECPDANQTDIFEDVRNIENNMKNDKLPDFLESLRKIQNKDEAIAKIRNGWTLENSHSLAIGDLYLMIGSDYKLQLDYWWTKRQGNNDNSVESNLEKLSSMLSKLVRLTRLTKIKTKLTCPCGHQCSDDVKTSGRGRRPLNDSFNEKLSKENSGEIMVSNNVHSGVNTNDANFRKPGIHSSNKSRLDPEAFKAQLDKLTPRYCNRRGRGIATKNVVVQRTLPLLPKASNGHAIVTLKLIPQTSQFSGEFMPVSLVTSRPNSPRDINAELPRRRNEQPIASQSPLSSGENENAVVEQSTSPTPSISALLEDHDPMMALGGGDITVAGATGSYECTDLPPSSPSPTVILREEDWLNGEVADYSLSSILGHLETPVKSTNCQSYDANSDMESQLQCLMTETSIDYMAKFADLAAKISSESSQ
ncbi:UNVERIFIED_CONTAM: hypothetical protein PYX00_005943 [Menopon gallinae]|uniref:SANT domain-containing protein n=1 Tax=Menopon gallinae TaxID=328185 RepID=A0AAW2HV77_9NEOP